MANPQGFEAEGRVARIRRALGSDAAFILAVFFAARAIVAIGFFAVAPNLPAPIHGISPLADLRILWHWDGYWYRDIIANGYEFARDGRRHNVAFFPLFPTIVYAIERLGIAFAPAAALVSNAAFLAALFVISDWLRGRCGSTIARFAIATLALMPPTLFTTVAYSESLYLLASALALRDFERRPLRAGAWAALASATRVSGCALAIAFAFVAIVERRGARFWIAAAIAPLGTIGFAAYQFAIFGDPLAFVHVQASWHPTLGFGANAWLALIAIALVSKWHWVGSLAVAAVALGYRGIAGRFGTGIAAFAATLAALVEARLWGWYDGSKLLFIGIAAYAIVRFRRHFTTMEIAYVTTGFALILAVGDPLSSERYAFGLVPTSIGLAFLWQRYPRLGYTVLAVAVSELAIWSVQFAQRLFIA